MGDFDRSLGMKLKTIPDRSVVGEIATTFIETCLDTNRDENGRTVERQSG